MTGPRSADVTVCVPAYEAEATIADCVGSVLEQGVSLEVLVADDCSSDRTVERAKSFDDERVTVVRNHQNLGRALNIASVLQRAEGQFITLLPADSRLPPGSLRRRLDALEAHADVAFALGDTRMETESGERLGTRSLLKRDAVLPPFEAVGLLLEPQRAFFSSLLARREAFEAVGGLRVDVAPSHRDLDLFLRLAATGGLVYVASPVAVDVSREADSTRELSAKGLLSVSEWLVLRSAADWATARGLDESATAIRASLRPWARRRIGHSLLASAGLVDDDPSAALGLALLADAGVRRSPLFLAAWLADAAPDRLVQPVLSRVMRRADRARRRRWNLDATRDP